MDTIPVPAKNTSSVDMVSRAVLETLAYSDIFDHPLTIEELQRYLTVPAETTDVLSAVANLHGRVSESSGYYFLAGRDEIVPLRKEREMRSAPLFTRAIRYGGMLGRFPYIRMVALTGSLAMRNVSANSDMDYLLVTQSHRLWTARAFAVMFGRLIRPLGDRLCSNIVISESAMSWLHRDLYSARELCQMVPVSGAYVYQRFRSENSWTAEFLPNAIETRVNETRVGYKKPESRIPSQYLITSQIETMAMRLQMKVISRRTNFSDETIFGPEVCQANFDQHRRRTREMYEKKLAELGIESPSPVNWDGAGMKVHV